MERDEGSPRFRKNEADVVCQSSLRHQNTTPEPSLKSPAHLRRLLPHAAPPPPCRKAALPRTGLHPQPRPLFDPPAEGAAADVMLGSLRGKSPSHSPEPSFKRPEDPGLGRGGACCVEGCLQPGLMPPPCFPSPQVLSHSQRWGWGAGGVREPACRGFFSTIRTPTGFQGPTWRPRTHLPFLSPLFFIQVRGN